MADKYSGSCLCGAITFEITGDFEQFYLCHCQHCRKDTGSAHAANLFATAASLQWMSGAEKVTRFDLPATRHSKWFCSVCGSGLPHVSGELLAVPAGSLDSEISIRPTAHIFMASKAGWDDALEKIPAMAMLPV